MKNPQLVEAWLRRAKSNLGRAKAGRVSKEILFEDLCFDCQQVAEKSLKAWMIHLDIIFPWTHSVARLVELLEENGLILPEKIKDALILTDYAVMSRYPGEYEAVTEEEYLNALALAKRVYAWVLNQVGK